MKHRTPRGSGLLSLLLCLSLLCQLGAGAWAAQLPTEGMLSGDASASAQPEAVQSIEAAPEAVQSTEAAPEAAQSTEAAPEAAQSTEAAPEAAQSAEAAPEAVQSAEAAPEAAQSAEAEADPTQLDGAEARAGQEPEESSQSRADASAVPDVDSPEFWEEFREEYAEDGDYLKRYELYHELGVKRAFENDDDIPGTVEALSEEELEAMATSGTTKSPYNGKTYTHSSRNKGKQVTFGVDVSYFQGSIDWKKVKAAGIKFAILRCGRTRVHSFSIGKDEKFDEYIKGAHSAGLQIGVYYFSQATSVKEAKQEAKKTLNYISPYREWITLPVFMDIETGKLNGKAYRINKVSRAQGAKNVRAYCQIIEDDGYRAGYYANPDDLGSICDVSQVSDYVCWIARWSTSNSYSGAYDYWQYGGGKVNGISGSVDSNFRYVGEGEDESDGSIGPPGQVTGLRVTEKGETHLGLSWDVQHAAECYKVEGKVSGGGFAVLATSVGNTCRLTGLSPGTSYTLRVKALNARGSGSASASVQVKTSGTAAAVPTAPAPQPAPEPAPEPVKRRDLPAPALVSAEGVQGGVRVRWKSVRDAELYRVFRKTKGAKQWTALKDTDKLSFVDKGAVDGTWYRYTVRCINAADKSMAGDYDKTGKVLTYYAAPTLTKATGTAAGVRVSFKKNVGVTNCRLYRATANGGWRSVAVGSGVVLVDKSAKRGEVYRYTVRGVSRDGKSYVTGFDPKGLRLCVLPAPSLTTVKSSGKTRLAAKWSKAACAQGYELRWVLGSSVQTKRVNGGGKTGVSVNNLKKGKTYQVTVRSYRKAEGRLWYSPWSGAKKVKIGK